MAKQKHTHWMSVGDALENTPTGLAASTCGTTATYSLIHTDVLTWYCFLSLAAFGAIIAAIISFGIHPIARRELSYFLAASFSFISSFFIHFIYASNCGKICNWVININYRALFFLFSSTQLELSWSLLKYFFSGLIDRGVGLSLNIQ